MDIGGVMPKYTFTVKQKGDFIEVTSMDYANFLTITHPIIQEAIKEVNKLGFAVDKTYKFDKGIWVKVSPPDQLRTFTFKVIKCGEYY